MVAGSRSAYGRASPRPEKEGTILLMRGVGRRPHDALGRMVVEPLSVALSFG
jgi:hypothetical protein